MYPFWLNIYDDPLNMLWLSPLHAWLSNMKRQYKGKDEHGHFCLLQNEVWDLDITIEDYTFDHDTGPSPFGKTLIRSFSLRVQ